MRLTAYKAAMEQAAKLPVKIPNVAKYLNLQYNPRNAARDAILKEARHDEGLSHREFAELVGFVSHRL